MPAPPRDNPVTVRFFVPSPELQPYVSSIYLTESAPPAGTRVSDWLLPEWASLRMADGADCLVAVGSNPLRPAPRAMLAGPTGLATRIELGAARIWGVGILPLGWARLIGAPAYGYADRLCDGEAEPACAALAELFTRTFPEAATPEATAAAIDAFLRALLTRRPPTEHEARIRAAHRLLIDEDIASVGEFAERLSLSTRTLERFSPQVFGFSPKLLLRRQRFTRSLAQFLLDPSLAWIRALDDGYVDQAHFVHDFRRFMGMSPSAYAACDHPVLRATAQRRAAAVGGAVQALHRP